MKRTLSIALVLGAVIIFAASPCLAQVINGCVKNNGQISIMTGPGQCKNGETPISWNATGPQGPPGPAGITNGIRAAVWGEFVIDGSDISADCSVPFFRGADAVTGVATGNGAECILTFTLPAGQPQTWGTAYACYTSIVGGNQLSFDTTCQYQAGFETTSGLNKPEIIIACRNGLGQAPTAHGQISFLCVAP
jgi:hypothetical protein